MLDVVGVVSGYWHLLKISGTWLRQYPIFLYPLFSIFIVGIFIFVPLYAFLSYKLFNFSVKLIYNMLKSVTWEFAIVFTLLKSEIKHTLNGGDKLSRSQANMLR